MVARVFMDAPISVDNKTTTTTFQYKGISNIVIPSLPQIPARNDSAFTLSLNEKFRSLNSYQYLALVPHKVDKNPFYTISISLGMNPCLMCVNGTTLVTLLNNV
ncbi:hypothetical protein AHAS_Ahas18G0182500 [Arachis hypogaea]